MHKGRWKAKKATKSQPLAQIVNKSEELATKISVGRKESHLSRDTSLLGRARDAQL